MMKKKKNSIAVPAHHNGIAAAYREGGLTAVRKNSQFQKVLFLILAISPSYIGYLLFCLYPNFLSVIYSFFSWDGLNEMKFVGFDNYVYMFKDRYFYRAIGHNLVITAIVPLLNMSISLFLAYVLANKNYRENKLYTVLFFLPNVLSGLIINMMWAFIYDGNVGLLNGILGAFGIDMNGFFWLGDKRTALLCTIPPTIWAGVGFNVIIFMNAMKNIPASLYESAILDGATHMQRLRLITVPLIRPIIKITLLFMFLGTFQSFENIMLLTGGGPSGATQVVGLYMYDTAFPKSGVPMYGYASTVGMFLFVVFVCAKLLIDKFTAKDKVEF